MFTKTDIFFIIIFIVIVSIIIGLNIVNVVDQKLSNVIINVPPNKIPDVVFNIVDDIFGILWLHSVKFDENKALVISKPRKKGRPNKNLSYRFFSGTSQCQRACCCSVGIVG